MQSTITNLNSHLLPTERQHCGKQLPWNIPLNQIQNLNLRLQKERFCAFLFILFSFFVIFWYILVLFFVCCLCMIFCFLLVVFCRPPHATYSESKVSQVSSLVWVRPSESPQKSPSWLSCKLQYTLQFPCKKSLYIQDNWFVICFSLFSYNMWFPSTGCFFNCSTQLSVLKRKTLFNQPGSFVHREFNITESLIGCPSFFNLVLKIGGNS